MSDHKNFLERWSRRKSEAADTADEKRPVGTGKPPAQSAALDRRNEPGARPQPPTDTRPAPDSRPAFDLDRLPPLESITEASDVRAFLAPGVPPELTRAALRRAWAADPAIRNFVGLQEYDWDFTDPAGIMGFGDLPPGYDVKSLVARVLGEPDTPSERTAAAPTTAPSEAETAANAGETGSAEPATSSTCPPDRDKDGLRSADATVARTQAEVAGLANEQVDPEASAKKPTDAVILQRTTNIASHNSRSEQQAELIKRRRSHGRALPK